MLASFPLVSNSGSTFSPSRVKASHSQTLSRGSRHRFPTAMPGRRISGERSCRSMTTTRRFSRISWHRSLARTPMSLRSTQPCEQARVHRQPGGAHLAAALHDLAATPGGGAAELDIATAYFNLAGFMAVAEVIESRPAFRLLLGAEPDSPLQAEIAGGPQGLAARRGIEDLEAQLRRSVTRCRSRCRPLPRSCGSPSCFEPTRSRCDATSSASCTARRTSSGARA